jgi:hypothetical protein
MTTTSSKLTPRDVISSSFFLVFQSKVMLMIHIMTMCAFVNEWPRKQQLIIEYSIAIFTHTNALPYFNSGKPRCLAIDCPMSANVSRTPNGPDFMAGPKAMTGTYSRV